MPRFAAVDEPGASVLICAIDMRLTRDPPKPCSLHRALPPLPVNPQAARNRARRWLSAMNHKRFERNVSHFTNTLREYSAGRVERLG